MSTAPYGFKEQGDFLNGCIKMETLMTPIELLDLLLRIENKTGRIRDLRWGPRTLDLEFYDMLVMYDDTLRIPHAEMHKREFVLIPLCEIAPDKVHPIFGKPVSELLDGLGSVE
jgi:dihydroneopterin aldolase/2-amino-4-hydroxy-6-hydroxymethyldihydropteridine diphosphokinase